jgi:hypothetical protein
MHRLSHAQSLLNMSLLAVKGRINKWVIGGISEEED